jgi:acyl dehydratase
MPIDLERVVGAALPQGSFSWSGRDIILYNLAIGAGNPPTDTEELRYTYESDLVAIPTFATIPPFGMMMAVAGIDGLDVNLAQILHGDHEMVVHGPIPANGTVTQEGRVVDVYDKGKGALMMVEVESRLEKTGDLLFTNRAGIFVRGEGGFGGDPGPSTISPPPDREPDHVVYSPTLPQQALLYRQVSGDLNPLHADPGFAGFAGYPRPILHGLCTYGIVAKALLAAVLGGDVSRFGSYRARFSGHVFPGETLVTRIWSEPEGWVLPASTEERQTTVLTNARLIAKP